MACKKCKKVFRKDVADFGEEDEYCPGCDNHYVIEATEGEKGKLVIEFDMARGHENKMFQDEREKQRGRVLMEDLDDDEWN